MGKNKNKGRGLIMDKSGASSKRGRGLMSASANRSGRRFGESAAEGSIRNAATNQKAAITTGVGDLINKQMDAQKQSAYDGISMPGQNEVVQVNDKAYGRGGYDDVVQSQYQNALANNEAQWQQQSKDFEQMAAERGWTPGSEVYNSQKQNLQKQQAQERQNLYGQAQQLGMQGQSLGIEGESARVNAQRGRFTDLSTQAQQQLGLQQGRRNESASDAAVLQGMTDPQWAQYQQQPFQYQMGKLGPEATKFAARASAAGNVNAAGIMAGAQQNVANTQAQSALDQLSAQQTMGLKYQGY